MPSSEAAGWSGIWLRRRADELCWRRRWLTTSPSSWPVWRSLSSGINLVKWCRAVQVNSGLFCRSIKTKFSEYTPAAVFDDQQWRTCFLTTWGEVKKPVDKKCVTASNIWCSGLSPAVFACLNRCLWKKARQTPVFLWICPSFCNLVHDQSVSELFGKLNNKTGMMVLIWLIVIKVPLVFFTPFFRNKHIHNALNALWRSWTQQKMSNT